MDRIKGITFFFRTGELLALHIHRSDESCAMDTFSRAFHNHFTPRPVWIYLPISQHDRALLLGIRESQFMGLNILVRTELMGDIIVGLQFEGYVKERFLAASAPLTMIYGEPLERRPIRFFGGYCKTPRDQPLPKPFRLEKPGLLPIRGDAYFSWAPLCGVSSTLVFYDQDTGFCRGILFHYHNGGSRAVGQCRLHVDPAEGVVRPVRFCFRAESPSIHWIQTVRRVQVKFTQATQTNHIEEGWESRPMEGLVKLWATGKFSFLVVEN